MSAIAPFAASMFAPESAPSRPRPRPGSPATAPAGTSRSGPRPHASPPAGPCSGSPGELSTVGARSVLRRYSDAWFQAANRHGQADKAGFPRRRRALIPIRFYHGTFTIEDQRVRLPVASGHPELWVRLARPLPYPPEQVRAVTLRRVEARHRRRVHHAHHQAAKQVVSFAVQQRVGILVVGDPKGITAKTAGRVHNLRLRQWRRTHLLQALRDKAELAGIIVRLVDERGTSSTCPACQERVPKPGGRNFFLPALQVPRPP